MKRVKLKIRLKSPNLLQKAH